jgi:uncharacterized protein YkwD
MASRLVQVVLLIATVSYGTFSSFTGLAPVAQAHPSPPVGPDIANRPVSLISGSKVINSAAGPLSGTDVSTYSLFLPLVMFQPVPESLIQVVNETNHQRNLHGCPPLTLNQQLVTAGQGHSNDMALNDFFSHTGSDGSSPWDRIQATGYKYSLAAENIAAGYSTPQAVVQGWMNSAGHRQNILNCDLEEIGVGYRNLENDSGQVNYHHYWTQVFASPR